MGTMRSVMYYHNKFNVYKNKIIIPFILNLIYNSFVISCVVYLFIIIFFLLDIEDIIFFCITFLQKYNEICLLKKKKKRIEKFYFFHV